MEEDVRGEEMGAWRSGRLDIFWFLVRRGSFVCGFLVEVLDSAGTVVGGASLTILE